MVLDMKDILLTYPLYPDSYFLFAFTWEATDTSPPDSFFRISELFDPGPIMLFQYVDDFLLYSLTLPMSQQATSMLLNFLGILSLTS